ncbi:MAG TPA: phosphoenolpyruvate carboxykinase, partial [Candidatus Binatia bacterium]|nr:phosphoenolpyruvate carboxykinase [Candidatus Binatia bacterium]
MTTSTVATSAPTPSPNAALNAWVEECARLCKPDRVHWVDGSDGEHDRLLGEMLASGTLHRLNPDRFPDCYLHRSDRSDVARTEHLTFICTSQKDDAGPLNNWMEPDEAKRKVGKLFDGAMRGRTMYVIPYVMGPLGSPLSKVGVEITDSPYVVANMRIMTRMGRAALEQLGASGTF